MAKWWVVVVVSALALVGFGAGIRGAADSHYDDAQTAGPDRFASLVAADEDGLLDANAFDFGFAASYAALGIALFVLLRGSLVAGLGAIFVVVGALADEIENVFLRVAIGRQSDGKDVATLLDVMHVFGWVKWAGIAVASVALVVRLVQWVSSRR